MKVTKPREDKFERVRSRFDLSPKDPVIEDEFDTLKPFGSRPGVYRNNRGLIEEEKRPNDFARMAKEQQEEVEVLTPRKDYSE